MDTDYRVIRAAIETEIDGYRYFLNAAERSVNPRATETWLSLSADEVEHMRILQGQLSQISRSGGLETGDDESGATEKASVALSSTVLDSVDLHDDLAALLAGLEVEARTRQFYALAATRTANPVMKQTYESLAAMEDGHYKLIEETHRYLSDPAGWNFDQARPISDGA